MSPLPPVPAALVPRHPDHAELLLWYLQREREHLLRTLEGLSEHDVRRPLTPTATSLLGLVKHVAGVEMGYLGQCVGRPLPDPPAWETEAAYDSGGDMWARAEEGREEIVAHYRRVWAHSDASVRELGMDAPAHVPWWPPEGRDTTLGWLLVHQVDETAHHAGHADILRESIDGRAGDSERLDEAGWAALRARVQQEADRFRDGASGGPLDPS